MHLVKEFGLLTIICIFYVVNAENPILDGYECIGGTKWKIAKFDKVYCYTKVKLPNNVKKIEGVISKNYCKNIDKDSHPASIHSKLENDFLENNFHNGFIGLFQPGKGKYNAKTFRWEDGTKNDFINWDKGHHLKPQPNNDNPIERLTRLRKTTKFHGWHDWIAKDLDEVICKKPATKVAAAQAPALPQIPVTAAKPVAAEAVATVIKVVPTTTKPTTAKPPQTPIKHQPKTIPTQPATKQTPATTKAAVKPLPPVKPQHDAEIPRKAQGNNTLPKKQRKRCRNRTLL